MMPGDALRMEATEFETALGDLGWSIDEAADRLMVDQRTIYIWLRGQRDVSGPATAYLRHLLRLKRDEPTAFANTV